MKIMLLHNIYKPYYRGGAEVIALNLARGFKDRGDEAVIVSLGYENKAEEIDGQKVYRVKPFNVLNYLDINAKPYWLRFIFHIIDLFNDITPWQVLRIARKEKPDYIFLQGIKGFGYVLPRLLKSRGFKVSLRVFDMQYIHPSALIPKNCNKACMNAWIILVKLMLGDIDYVIFPSEFVRDVYLRHGFFKKSKIEVIPNPLPAGSAVGSQAIVPNQTKNFLYIGQMLKYKGVEDLIEACQSIEGEFTLHLAGTGNDLNDFKRLVVQDKRFIFYGQRDKEFMAAEIWPKIDVLVNPSRVEETFGMVVIEAYAKGKPVIASKIGALPELIKEGETGWLFFPGDVSQLRYKLQNIVDGKVDLAPLRTNCLAEAEKYSVSKYLDRLYAFVGL